MAAPNDQPEPIPRWPAWRTGLLILAVWSVPALINGLQTWIQRPDEDAARSFGWYLLRQGPIWAAWALLTPVVMRVARRRPLLRGRPLSTVGLHLAPSVAVAAAACGGAIGLDLLIRPEAVPPGGLFELAWRGLVFVPFGMIVYWLIALIASAVENGRAARAQERRAARLETSLARARLDALLAQLQPHFLFNTLNSISSLVRQEQTGAAVEVIGRLADLLRRTLRSGREPFVELRDEIDFVETYLSIEQVRLGERLRTAVSVDPDAARARLPAMILQPLVENAVRHGIAPSVRGGAVEIRVQAHGATVEILVENDGVPLAERHDGGPRGLGLDNTRARLREVYGQGYELVLEPRSGGGTRARLRVPLRPPEARLGQGAPA